MIHKARSFAICAHANQKYGYKPYLFHLDAVAELVRPSGEDAEVVAYLHDTVEDTDITIQEIEVEFGINIAACVSLVTDELGHNRKERKDKTYAKLSKVIGPTELALVVKSADRLANVRASIEDKKQELLEMYREEHPAFRGAVYRIGLCEALWVELDSSLSEQCFETNG